MPGRTVHCERSRESRLAGVLLALAYFAGERKLFELTVREDGVHIRLTCDPDKVSGADREEAAAWLKAYKPRLTHDQRYAYLWQQGEQQP